MNAKNQYKTLLLLLLFFPGILFAKGNSADKIVKKVDEIRFPQADFKSEIKITTLSPGEKEDIRKFQTLSKKGAKDSLVVTVEPAEDKGQILLMKDRDLWAFMPKVSQPIRLSLSQRLTGLVANGDLARANFSGDYSSKILRTEKKGKKRYIVIELKAVDRSVTYPRALLWANKKSYRPLKVEFYSLSNRLLKTCKYTKYKKILGRMRPTRLIMEDAVKKGYRSILDYTKWKKESIPSKMFTKQYLKKINPMSLAL